MPRLSLTTPPPAAVRVLKVVAFLLALIPAARLGWRIYAGELGANPIEFITRDTGDWTLIFLCITLSVTPLRRWLSWPWLIRLRRQFGLFAFFYACLHFVTYLVLDKTFDWSEIVRDIAKRPYITVGFAAFVLLIPLAATSTQAMVRRLGGARWRRLHQAVYLIACLAILHFWWMKAGKVDFTKPVIYGSIMAVLLGSRLVRHWREQRAAPTRAASRA